MVTPGGEGVVVLHYLTENVTFGSDLESPFRTKNLPVEEWSQFLRELDVA